MAAKLKIRRVVFAGVRGVGLVVFFGHAHGSTGAIASAQDAPQGFRSSVDLVPVYATVTTKSGTFAAGLAKEEFTVLDNGVPQPIV